MGCAAEGQVTWRKLGAFARTASNFDGNEHMGAQAQHDVNSTIRHLRRKRRSIVHRRRRLRMLLAASGAIAFALGTAMTVASFTGANLADAAAARAQSFMELMGKRSPGERTAAQLTKTKTVHKLLSERDAPEVTGVPANLAEVIAPPLPDIVPVDLGPPQLALLGMPTLPGGILMPPPSGGPKVPPGGGGGCCGGPPTETPPTPPNVPPPPALPEPGTWAMMLMGFGAMGVAMRRGRKLPALAQAA